MRFISLSHNLPKLWWFVLVFMIGQPTSVFAIDSFFDYLPKYRKFKSHYQIDKIEYKEKRTIIYFRYVVQETGSTTFYGGNHPNSWYLRTPPRMRGLEIQFKQLEVSNIAINSEIRHQSLISTPEISYSLNRGDVVTFQVHFVRIPSYIRMLDMIEGKDGHLDQDKLNCFDIMIKTKNNPLLGKVDNMNAVVERFEQSFTYIKPKVTQQPAAATVASHNTAVNPSRPSSPHSSPLRKSSGVRPSTTKSQAEREVVNIGHAKEPINYMPEGLTSLIDLKCNTRVYLPNVIFKEGETKFSGRVKAIQNIRLIVEYLNAYPNARIYLYGHTDIFGNERRNLELSRERAMAVKRELVNMGIEPNKISVYFFGGTQPLQKYKNGGSSNRRVEVEPICKD